MNTLRSFSVPAIIVVGIVLTWSPPAAWPQTSSGRTVLDGAYTAAQSSHGETIYKTTCQTCHGVDLMGGEGAGRAIPLRTDRFIDNWREESLGPLLETIKRQHHTTDSQPRLPESDYIAVLAYLLRANEFPAGSEELTAANLGAVRMTGKGGPKPLPNNSRVSTVGCLVSSGADWTLTRAAEPIRNRNLTAVSPDELQAFKDMTLGTITFQLRNVDLMDPPFNPAPHAGHKMLVKGVMVNAATTRRITPQVMVMLGECP
jgi:hypothetical protein